MPVWTLTCGACGCTYDAYMQFAGQYPNCVCPSCGGKGKKPSKPDTRADFSKQIDWWKDYQR